jgi:hypothetical protein
VCIAETQAGPRALLSAAKEIAVAPAAHEALRRPADGRGCPVGGIHGIWVAVRRVSRFHAQLAARIGGPAQAVGVTTGFQDLAACRVANGNDGRSR